MAGDRSSRGKHIRRAILTLAGAAALTAALAGPTAAQTAPAPAPSFSFAGYSTDGKAVGISTDVTGDLGYCRNANGLGSELYFDGTGTNGLTFRHATVSPMVVPIHIGVIGITNPDPANLIQDNFVTIGVVDGTPADFGTVGPSSAQYGGLAVGPSVIGVVAWKQTADSSCAQSRVMPILNPLVSGGGTSPVWGATSTTVPPTTDTTVPPTTDTTVPPTTDTTVPPTTDTTVPPTTDTTVP